MQISFRRDIQHRYVVIAAADVEAANYKAEMISRNQIEGFAECYFEQMNEERLFYYSIPAGCRSLSDRLENEAVNEELYRKLFTGLAQAFGQLRDFLLDVEELLLRPELIFLKEESAEPLFLYFPAQGEPLETSCRVLSEFLIGKLDHKEKEAVRLGYAFYRSSMSGAISEELLYQLAQGRMEEAKESTEGRKEEEVQPDLICEEEPSAERPFWEDAPQQAEKRSPGWKHRFRRGSAEKEKSGRKKERKPFFRRRKSEGKEEESDWNFLMGEEAMQMEYGQTEMLRTEVETERENPEEPIYETVLLKKADREAETIRAWLIPQEDFLGENLYLEEDSYLIGKSIAGAQLALESPAVSRVHARIFWKENTYLLTDLGSRNGTLVNGEQLEPGAKVPLSDGDEIRFADKIFLYYSREKLQDKEKIND